MTTNKLPVERNIPLLYAIAALRWFMLIMPILVLFFRENGLSMAQILGLQAIFSIVIVLAEIPSGYLSDVIGRRVSMILGTTLSALGFALYCFSFGFWGFLAAEIMLGIGASFVSGTDSALLFDSLLESGRGGEYTRLEGRMLAVNSISEGLAGILGGLLALVSMRMPFFVEAGLAFLAVPLAFLIVEPQRSAGHQRPPGWDDIAAVLRFAMQEHKKVKWLIIYGALVSVSSLTMVWFIQPYLQLSGLPLAWFGVAWAALQFSVAGFSLLAWRVEELFGRKRTLTALIFIAVAAYALLAATSGLWSCLFIFLFYMLRGLNGPLIRSCINDLIPSERRATVLSLQQFVFRFHFALLGPFVGWVADLWSFTHAFALCALVFLLVAMPVLKYLRRYELI